MIKTVIFLLIVLCSNVIQAITGFAGTMLAMPGSIRLIGLDQAGAILNLMGLLSSLWIAAGSFRQVNGRELCKISGTMGLGMLLGQLLLDKVSTGLLLLGYGILIICIALYKLLGFRRFHVPAHVYPVLLLAAGIIHRLFVSGGSLLVVYAAARLPEKNRFRSTLSAVWVMLNGVLLLTHIQSGLWQPPTVKLACCCIPFLAGGIWLGNRLHRRVSQDAFLKLTYVLLLISGVLLLR